jgi:PAS domain S-box-containing protein
VSAGERDGATTKGRDTELARAEAKQFEACFTHAAVGMALVGLDGRFLRINQAFCRITGYPEAELLARDFQSITHADDLEADLDLLKRLTDGEIESYEIDKRYLRADGGEVWVQLNVSMVRRGDGSPRQYVAQVQDLSDRRAAERALAESEARYRLIAENTTDIIVMSELTGRTLYMSGAVRRMGWEPAQSLGDNFAERAHPDDVPAVARAFVRLMKGGPAETVRWRGRWRAGDDWSWLESRPSLLRDPVTGKPTGFLDVIRDVGVQVEQEVALAAARAEAEAAAAVKSQFLANMSHEIRTPLTALLGFAGLLREQPLDPVAAGYLARITGAGNALQALVNDILDFSKLEAGQVELKARPTDIAETCRETLGVFAGEAGDKDLELTFTADPDLAPALIDADRLRQMLLTLIGNAVKFTETGSVSVRVLSDRPERVRIEVADTGPGLNAEAQAILFQRFTQIDGSLTRKHGGAGLGLAICKGLAEAMGGGIAVESALGEGSTFRLSLPAPPARATATGELAAIDGTRVCVVDDNPLNRELARKVLEAAGAEVCEAADGEAALTLLAGLPVDLVLMDLRMPGLDGCEALARLRAAPGPNQDIPVLAFSADTEAGDAEEVAEFDGVVAKPISPADMYAAIARATQWAADPDEDLTHASAS